MKLILILCAFMIHFSTHAQDAPYSFSKKTDAIISTTLLAGTASYWFLQKNITPLTSTDIANLSTASIHSFDRNTTSLYNPNHTKISKQIAAVGFIGAVGVQGITLVAAATFSQSYKQHFGILATMWLQTNVAAYVGTGICKAATLRTRPYVYNLNAPLSEKTTADARQSFFSRHTSMAAANTFLAAHVISSYYTPSPFTYSVWTAAAIVPAAVGYFRVSSGEHFPTDVIAGYIYGAGCGLLIPYVHTLHKKDNSHVRINILSPEYVSVSFVW